MFCFIYVCVTSFVPFTLPRKYIANANNGAAEEDPTTPKQVGCKSDPSPTEDTPTRPSVKLHAPPGGFSSGLW